MNYLAAAAGALIGTTLGVFIGWMIVEKRRYGTWGRAWCSVVHKSLGCWQKTSGRQYRCTCCDRPFTKQDHWGY